MHKRIAIVGAECTGKSSLAEALSERLGAVFVPEALRLFVEQNQRVPVAYEMLGVAQWQRSLEQDAAARGATLLICDTTPLLVAVYAQHYFGAVEPALLSMTHDAYDATLLAGDDIAWAADGLQRDGEHVRAAVQMLLRAWLQERAIAYTEVRGDTRARVAAAECAISRALAAG